MARERATLQVGEPARQGTPQQEEEEAARMVEPEPSPSCVPVLQGRGTCPQPDMIPILVSPSCCLESQLYHRSSDMLVGVCQY